MLLIPCPYCGERSEREFVHGGDASALPPDLSTPVDDRAWADTLYLRDNPAGPFLEYWFHRHGCRQWIVVCRDTLDHRILDVSIPGTVPGAMPGKTRCNGETA